MNKNEIEFLKSRINNLKSKIEVAQDCINSAINDLDESDDFMKIIEYNSKNKVK